MGTWGIQLPSICQKQLLQRLHILLIHVQFVVARVCGACPSDLTNHHLIVLLDLGNLADIKELAEVKKRRVRRFLVFVKLVGLTLSLLVTLLQPLGHHLLADGSDSLELVHETASLLHKVLVIVK